MKYSHAHNSTIMGDNRFKTIRNEPCYFSSPFIDSSKIKQLINLWLQHWKFPINSCLFVCLWDCVWMYLCVNDSIPFLHLLKSNLRHSIVMKRKMNWKPKSPLKILLIGNPVVVKRNQRIMKQISRLLVTN